MVNFVSIVLAAAAMIAPHAEEQPAQRITLGGRAFFPGGKIAPSVSQRFVMGTAPATWYVFTGKTLCEAQTVSSEKPAFAGNGWRVDVKAGPGGTLTVTWERLWAGGKPTSGGGTRSLTVGSGTPLVLDSIDGGARLQRQEIIDRLKAVSPTDLRALTLVDDIDDGRTYRLRSELTDLEKTRKQLVEVQRLGAQHPEVVRVDLGISETRKALQEALAANLSRHLMTIQSSAPTAAVDGCDALSMNLQITAEQSLAPLPTETEIWLIHRDPAGIETMQRQVVRSVSGNGSYVFDDVVVKTEAGQVTIEVSGSVSVRPGASWGYTDPYLSLDVNRRYVTTGSGFNWKTKEGGTAFNQAIRFDEVLAFNLLPLKDDGGLLVGHRFSVRVRTKSLK